MNTALNTFCKANTSWQGARRIYAPKGWAWFGSPSPFPPTLPSQCTASGLCMKPSGLLILGSVQNLLDC